MIKRVVLPLAVIALLVAAYFWAAFSWSYSTGDRAGWVQKLSKKGWICKTYEGELAQYVVTGVTPQIWGFTVSDPAVAQKLNTLLGERVRLHYGEHVGLPTSCFGDTRYFVDRVEEVAPPASAPVTPGPAPALTPLPST